MTQAREELRPHGTCDAPLSLQAQEQGTGPQARGVAAPPRCPGSKSTSTPRGLRVGVPALESFRGVRACLTVPLRCPLLLCSCLFVSSYPVRPFWNLLFGKKRHQNKRLTHSYVRKPPPRTSWKGVTTKSAQKLGHQGAFSGCPGIVSLSADIHGAPPPVSGPGRAPR